MSNKMLNKQKSTITPRPSTIHPDELYSIKEASAVLKISPATLRSWVYQGSLPVVRLGRRTMLRGSTILDMVENGFQPSARK